MKQCSKCNQTLTLESFHIQRDGKQGRKCWCKECQKAHDRTKRGLAIKMYANQKCHARARGYLLPDYSAEELYKWLLNNPEFHELHAAWVDSGYQKRFTPSCDRINDYISYRLDNIQIVYWNENLQKAGTSRVEGSNLKKNIAVDMLTLDGTFLHRFHSLSEAARFCNGSFVGIWEAVNKRERKYKKPDGSIKTVISKSAYGSCWRVSTIPNNIDEIK